MSDNPSTTDTRTPIHLWIVGVLALLWNAMGAYDYLMTQTQNEAYMARFTPEQLEYFYGFPAWAVAFWALAVWGSVLGSIFLLMRKSWAYPTFIVAFASMCVTTLYNYGLSEGLEMAGGIGPLIFSAVIFLVALGLVFYARAMKNRGVLA